MHKLYGRAISEDIIKVLQIKKQGVCYILEDMIEKESEMSRGIK